MSHTENTEDMRQRLCSAFHKSRNKMSNSVKRKLILHFDINKTIVPVDSATGETVEAALNIYLSGLAWGKDREGEWHSSRGELSSSPFEANDVSFYKFEEKRLLPHVSRDRAALRYHLTSFTDRPQGTNFKPYLNNLLESLKWKLPYEEQLHKEVTVPGTKSCRYHFILPAFYKLLNHLVQNERDFAVIFRTFGSDAKSVLRSIKVAISCRMPFCHNLDSLLDGMSDDVAVLKRDSNLGKFIISSKCGFCCVNSDSFEKCECIKTDDEMYSELTNLTGIWAIQDDCADWYRHNFDPTRGKPLWIDPSDPSTQHIFFDDNFRPGNADSIINLRLRETSENFRDVSRSEEYKFVNTNIVPVVFSEAILDNDYFVRKLIKCEENFSRVLETP